MEITFADDDLDRLETDPRYTHGLGPDIVRSYRKLMQYIRAATDERDFYARKSLHYEKLRGNRQHQRSMRLNAQFRLIVEIEESGSGRRVRIVSIEDYH